MSEQISTIFPIITPERQRTYEQTALQTGVRSTDAVPCICGYYGRACRRRITRTVQVFACATAALLPPTTLPRSNLRRKHLPALPGGIVSGQKG